MAFRDGEQSDRALVGAMLISGTMLNIRALALGSGLK
jgi:hypothetical protein